MAIYSKWTLTTNGGGNYGLSTVSTAASCWNYLIPAFIFFLANNLNFGIRCKMIVSVKQILQDIFGLITIASINDVMAFTSDKGSANIDIPDNTYEPDNLITALQTAMNANTTLTGTGAVTFAVTYSSTTGKVTIDATVGHTIALTYSTSDAALTFGFTQSKSATQIITADQPIPGNPQSIDVVTLHQRAEERIKSILDREFESTTYYECHDGTEGNHLYLPQYPITTISYLGTKTDAIKIKNTSTDANNAYVTIDDTNMVLTVSGGTNASTTTLALATYSTLTLLVAAINAIGKGWSTELYDNDYSAYLSANLIKIENYFVGSWDGTAATYDYLPMIDQPFSGYIVYGKESEGYIYYPSGFQKGHQNIAIKYTAGYSSANMPYDLQGLISDIVSMKYNEKSQSATGIKQFRIAQYSVTFGNVASIDGFDQIYAKYRKVRL